MGHTGRFNEGRLNVELTLPVRLGLAEPGSGVHVGACLDFGDGELLRPDRLRE